MHAIIETGGKQYRIAVGDEIEVEKIESNDGAQINFTALLIEDGENSKIGRPLIEGSQVSAEVVKQDKGPKLISYTYRKRKASERKVGHRQPLTVIKITGIQG